MMRSKEANQIESVYIGVISAEERSSTIMGEDVGPTQEVARLAARDLHALKRSLSIEEEKIFYTLQKEMGPYNLHLTTEIQTLPWETFKHQMTDPLNGWNNAQEVFKEIALGKAVVIESIIQE
jgi:hypothetical protein